MTKSNKVVTQETSSRRGRDGVADFKPKRNNVKKQGMEVGEQPVSLKCSRLAYSVRGTELIKLTLQNIKTKVEEVFNFINGSNEIMSIMDVLDPTGEGEFDFNDYINAEFMVEVVKTPDGFKNVIDAWDIPNHTVAIAATEEEEDDYDDYEYEEFGGEDDEESEINRIFVD